MSIPYNDDLSLATFRFDPKWHQSLQAPALNNENQVDRAKSNLWSYGCKEPVTRSVQFIRDLARLVLKVPIRAIKTPIFLEKNWQERERATVNAKLTGYAFVQLVSVPVKFMVALVALAISTTSAEKAKRLLDTTEEWTKHLDGRASQLEALKEEGAKSAKSRQDFDEYRAWLYNIDPKLCCK